MRKQHAPKDQCCPLEPTLIFDPARLTAQLRIVGGQFEEAIEQAGAGAAALDAVLLEMGYEETQRDEDPGLRYLRGMGCQLRQSYGITHTLTEQRAEALENEDHETAVQLRDALARRPGGPLPDESATA